MTCGSPPRREVTLERVPSLADSYARVLGAASRAVVLLRRPGAGTVPDLGYVTHGVRVDPERLTAYQHLLGEPATDELPAGYLHVLAFPLAVALMVRDDFPLPVLGLVHLANHVEQARPVRADEVLTVRAWARGLAPHRRGTQVEVVAAVDSDAAARVRGSAGPAWCGVSTYLAKGVRLERRAGPGTGPEEPGAGTGPEEPGAGAGPAARSGDGPRGPATARWNLGTDVGRRYAAVSGDRNPIHLSAATARPFGFRGTVAHGMYLAARALAGVGAARGPSFTWDVNFEAPVVLPGRVDVRIAPTAPVSGHAGREYAGWDYEGWDYEGTHPRTGRRHFLGKVVPTP
jgi:acyl dehydratase